jgi:hypothetical protein
MDHFFESFSGPDQPPPDDHHPGYAPAYPPYQR